MTVGIMLLSVYLTCVFPKLLLRLHLMSHLVHRLQEKGAKKPMPTLCSKETQNPKTSMGVSGPTDLRSQEFSYSSPLEAASSISNHRVYEVKG